MQINEAVGVLDNYFGDLQLNPREVAWQCIRKALVEGQKPSANRQSMPYFCTCISGRDKPKIIVTVCPECKGMLW